ncbi:7619_t:CDS:1, partial [Cetraspora pellucida]
MAKMISLPNQNLFKIATEDSQLRILEFEVNFKGDLPKQVWERITQDIKNKIEKISTRNLSFKEKILLSKSFLISKI